MAKKKEVKNIEELLGEALITKEEQPYKIPSNWEWVRLKSLGDIYNGNSINEKVKEDLYSNLDSGYNYISTKDIDFESNEIDYENGIKIPFEAEKFRIAYANSPLICAEGGSAGKKIGYTTKYLKV